nr:lysylphosphatidylglycerol synthase transmembrane domain-containing protein [Pseudomonas syringae]
MDHVGDSLDPAAIVQKAQPVTGSLLLSGWRYRAVLLSIVFSAMGYLGFSLWGGWQAVSAATGKVGLLGIGVALLMSAINYALRFVRWQLYLSVLGHPLAWRKSLRIYLAGFALTTTPGKAGEALRGVLLRPLGVLYPQSFAAFVSERLSDLLAIVLLTLFGLSWYPQAQPMILLGLALVLTGSLVLSRRHLLERLQVSLSTKNTRVSSLWQQLFNVLLAARQCLHGNVLLTASLLSLLAWSAEALAFYWMLGWMGAQIPLTFAVFTYALAMLAGALSFMPGGLGSAEAVMVGLLMFKGMPGADAVAATVLIRLATLWFAVAIGAVMLSRFTGATPVPNPQP